MWRNQDAGPNGINGTEAETTDGNMREVCGGAEGVRQYTEDKNKIVSRLVTGAGRVWSLSPSIIKQC